MQKVFISGIAGGFGKRTALTLLDQGYEVAGSVRSRDGKNTDTVAMLEAAGGKIVSTAPTQRQNGRSKLLPNATGPNCQALASNPALSSQGPCRLPSSMG